MTGTEEQPPDEAILAVIDEMGWPDDREKVAFADALSRPREYWDLAADVARAVLAAVTPVIRRQVAEEIAADLETASGSLGWLPMRYDAAAIARSHSTQPTEEETTNG